MGENRHLPESELDIMLVEWGAGGPVSAPAILEGLERPLTASALHSYLKRLEEKGFLSCKKAGKVNTYTAMVAREDYQRSEGESFLKKLYGSSISRFALLKRCCTISSGSVPRPRIRFSSSSMLGGIMKIVSASGHFSMTC